MLNWRPFIKRGILFILFCWWYSCWLYKLSSQQTSSWSDGQLVKHQRTFFNICLYQRLHKFTSDQLFCTRDGPLEKWWAGRVIQKIHAKESDWKKIMQTRSDEKADNCNAAKNFWAATLYSSVLSPSGIPIHLIISTIRTMDTILFPGWYILCATTWIKIPASWKSPTPHHNQQMEFMSCGTSGFSLYPFWNLQNPLWSTHISPELIELQTWQNFWHTAFKVKISTQNEEKCCFILHKKRKTYIIRLACKWALCGEWKTLFSGYSRIYVVKVRQNNTNTWR